MIQDPVMLNVGSNDSLQLLGKLSTMFSTNEIAHVVAYHGCFQHGGQNVSRAKRWLKLNVFGLVLMKNWQSSPIV